MDAASSGTCIQREAGWPLLHLPGPAQQALVAQLAVGERRSLRLAGKAATALVDRWTTHLRISHEELLAGGAALQQRYATVARLVLSAGHNYRVGSGFQPPQLLRLAPWPAIRAVTVKGGHLRSAVQSLGSFPCVQECCLQRVELPDTDEAAMTAADFSNLPASLASLAWFEAGEQLNNQQLDALASVPVLTRLEARLHEPGPSSWAAIARMLALKSLTVACYNAEPAAVDLRSLTLLTHLKLRGSSVLQLPKSLLQLDVLHLPPGPVPPCLTALALCDQPLEQQLLVALAAGCPTLGNLEVRNTCLSVDCNSVALTALTQLGVTNRCSSSGGVQLSRVFPRLQALRLRSITVSGGTARLALLEGLACLQRLDVGSYDFPVVVDNWTELQGQGHVDLPLQLRDFQLLAQLPALSSLRLDMTAQHVAGVASLSQLRHVEWVWNGPGTEPQASDMVDALRALFRSVRPLAQLRTAAMCWLDIAPWSPFDLLGGVVDAAISWLVRAPALAEVQWIGSAACHVKMLTEQRLSALAPSSSIRRFVISCLPDYELRHFGQPDFELHDGAGNVLASLGVEVVVLQAVCD